MDVLKRIDRANFGLIYEPANLAICGQDYGPDCIAQLGELGDAGKLPAGSMGQTLARAYEAFTAERWATVIDLLEPIMPELPRIGGSRAQSDLVTNTLLAAYVNDGRPEAARALIDGRDDRRPTHAVAGLPSA